MSLEVGSVLRGKYLLDESIGRGGMGEVFAATDQDGRRVAIKVVRRLGTDEHLMARLHREAEAAWRVRSAYVPELLEVDTTEEGELFLVMELLEGETLAQRLSSRNAALPWSDVVRIGEDVLLGLIDAHEAGVVHRDLKPGNIFLETLAGGLVRAKILDFGVCKLDMHDGERLTTTGEAVGTISYMAPEQIRSASKVDARADVYGFGMLVFEALSGRLPHDASGQIAMIASKLERPAKHVKDTSRVPFPPGLDALVAKCLERKPQDRFASARDVLASWRSFGAPTLAPKSGHGFDGDRDADPDRDVPSAGPSATTRAFVLAKRNTKIGLVVAASALFAFSAVIVVALRNRAPSNASRAAARTVVVDSAHAASAQSPSQTQTRAPLRAPALPSGAPSTPARATTP